MRDTFLAKRDIIVSVFFALVSLGLYAYFPTTLFFDEAVSFLVFIILLPILYLVIILHKPLKTICALPTDILSQLGIAILLGVSIGGILGVIASMTTLIPQYADSLTLYSNNFWIFLFYEFFFVLPSVFGSVFFGSVFVREIFADYNAAWLIGGMTTVVLFMAGGTPFLLILLPLLIIPTLHKIHKDHFLTLTTTLFIAFLIFDTFIIKSFL